MPAKRCPANGHGLPSSRSAFTNWIFRLKACASRSTATTSSPRSAKKRACRPAPLATSSTGPRSISAAQRTTQSEGASPECGCTLSEAAADALQGCLERLGIEQAGGRVHDAQLYARRVDALFLRHRLGVPVDIGSIELLIAHGMRLARLRPQRLEHLDHRGVARASGLAKRFDDLLEHHAALLAAVPEHGGVRPGQARAAPGRDPAAQRGGRRAKLPLRLARGLAFFRLA